MADTLTQAEVLMAAAEAAQAEAIASRAVADSVKAESLANPNDQDLAASVIAKEAEAVKDQAAADEALAKAVAAESEEGLENQIQQPIIASAVQTVEQTPVVAETPKVISQGVVEPSITTAVKPAPIAKPLPVAKNVVSTGVVTTVGKTTAVSGSFSDTVLKIKKTGTAVQRALVSQLDQYVTAMKPSTPIDAVAGARQQTNLWRIIQNVIERSGDEFKPCYALLLAYFEEYKNDVFHERYVFRFAENTSLSSTELATYQQMINLIKLTCSPVGRAQALRQVDLGRTMKNNISEPARQNILEFYNV